MAGYSFSLGNPSQRQGSSYSFPAGSSPYQQQYGQGQGRSQTGSSGGGQFAPVLPGGGVYGAQKWSSSMGSNAVDIFVPRGTPVTAPVSGTLQMGQNGQLILVGDNGWNFAFRHGQTQAQGHVSKGQQIGVVNDPSLESLGNAPWGNMPDKYQHLELSVSQGSPSFPGIPGGGGNVDAAQWLEQQGYQGSKIGRTPGPPDAQGGGMGMGGPGGPGGMPSFGGMPGAGGNPFGGSPFGMGQSQGNPFMGQGGPPGFGMGSPGGGGFSPGGSSMGRMSSGGFGSYGGQQMGSFGMGAPMGMPPNPFMMMGPPPGFSGLGGGGGAPPPQMSSQMPSFMGMGQAFSPMGAGLGNPFSFGAGMGGPGAAGGMMMNPFGGAGPAGAASMYGGW